MKPKSKYNIKKGFNICYFALVCFCFILTIIRWINSFNSDIVFINNTITSHISNFSLSMLFYLAYGYIMVLFDIKFRYVIVLGISLILGNFAYELFLSIINTKDIVDAIYGLAGSLLSFIYLVLMKKYGLILNEQEDK